MGGSVSGDMGLRVWGPGVPCVSLCLPSPGASLQALQPARSPPLTVALVATWPPPLTVSPPLLPLPAGPPPLGACSVVAQWLSRV